MAKDPGRKKRLAMAKSRVRTLVKQGVPFNPAKASDVLINQAVRNTENVGSSGLRGTGSGASGAIRARAPGTARAPKGGPITFKPSDSPGKFR